MSNPMRAVPLPTGQGAARLFDEVVQAVWWLSRGQAQRKWERRLTLLRAEFLRLTTDTAAGHPDWWEGFHAFLLQAETTGWELPPTREGARPETTTPEPEGESW